jgi:hypothetical protein
VGVVYKEFSQGWVKFQTDNPGINTVGVPMSGILPSTWTEPNDWTDDGAATDYWRYSWDRAKNTAEKAEYGISN